MFDLEDALSELAGGQYSYADLRSKMSDIRIKHLSELPPEVSVDDLIRIARQSSLIGEEAGKMSVRLSEVAVASAS